MGFGVRCTRFDVRKATEGKGEITVHLYTFEGLSVFVCNQDMKLHINVKIRALSVSHRGHMGSVITASCGV